MKILVIGGSHGTGALAVKEALARGHEVTSFARRTQKADGKSDKLHLVVGDFHRPESVAAAVAGQDAVIITASSSTLKGFKENPRFFSQGTGYAVEAMKKHGVRRIVVLSALGTGESRKLFPLLRKLIALTILRRPFKDHDRQEKLVQGSGLEWVVARPARLTDGPANRRYVKTDRLEKVPGQIARADVAAFLVEAAESPAWVGKAVHLGG